MVYLKKPLILFFLIFFVGCSSTYNTQVDSYKNNEIDTSQYQTFAWLNETKILLETKDVNPIVKLMIDDEIEAAFIAKGYRLTKNAETADFTISYTVGSREQITVSSYPSNYGSMNWGGGYYGGYYGRGFYGSSYGYERETRVKTYTEGKLAIDVFDVKAHQPAWHGVGTKKISSSDEKDPQEAVKSIVVQVLSQF